MVTKILDLLGGSLYFRYGARETLLFFTDTEPYCEIQISFFNICLKSNKNSAKYFTGYQIGVADPHHVNADPDPNFILMLIRIRFLLIIKLKEISDPQHSDPAQFDFKLLNFDFDAEPDQAFEFDADSDQYFHKDANLDPPSQNGSML